jgi:hypothetical protein
LRLDDEKKDGRSQRLTLANNLPANAAGVPTVHAVHNGRGAAWRQGPLLSPAGLHTDTSARRYVCRTAPAKLAVELSVWIAPLKEALTQPPHGQWQNRQTHSLQLPIA